MKRHDAHVGLISRTVLVFAIEFGGASFVLAEELTSPPASSPTVQQEKGTPDESGQVQERTVSLTQALHFTDAKGQDVVVGPGSYRVGAEGTNRIRLLPAEIGEAVVIDAVSFKHQQAVERPVPVTVPDPQQPDVLHLALLSPGGAGLDAIGTYSGVKPRQVMDQMRFMTAVNMQFVVQAPSVVTIYEHPNFGGRSQTLGVGGHILSDFNDMASSIQVPAGLVALLYEHVDAGGGYGLSVDVLEDRPDLAQVNFNDTLSYVCVFSSPTPQGFIWARASVQNGQFVAGHWERQRVGGTPVNPTAVVAPPLPPHPANAPPASCGGGPIVRDHRTPPPPPPPTQADLVPVRVGNSYCHLIDAYGQVAVVTIANRGSAAAPATVLDLEFPAGHVSENVPKLSPSAKVEVRLFAPTSAYCPPGNCIVTIRVDATNLVTETAGGKEANNVVIANCIR